MKLYTEEQVIKVVNKAFWQDIDNANDAKELMSGLTPIELPSDYVIREASLIIHPPKMQNDYGKDYDDNIQYRDEWSDGAKWVINQIKQQDNEDNN